MFAMKKFRDGWIKFACKHCKCSFWLIFLKVADSRRRATRSMRIFWNEQSLMSWNRARASCLIQNMHCAFIWSETTLVTKWPPSSSLCGRSRWWLESDFFSLAFFTAGPLLCLLPGMCAIGLCQRGNWFIFFLSTWMLPDNENSRPTCPTCTPAALIRPYRQRVLLSSGSSLKIWHKW